MKKLLLFIAGLNLFLSSFAQVAKPKPSGMYNMAKKNSLKFEGNTNKPLLVSKSTETNTNNIITTVETPEQNSAAMPPTNISWKLLSGSSNCYGQLESHSKPLQYNPNVNAVSFIHRKSAAYTETPTAVSSASSGVIVAEISTDWGLTWDSTCIWNDNTNAGRYPQGAIYSAAGNTNIANAYIVGCGPTTDVTDFTGNWYASKKLAAAGSTLFNTTADATPLAQQFVSFAASNNSWSNYGFTSTDDGIVRSLALVQGNNIELGDAAKMRGVAVDKGTYNAGVFNWTYGDSILPSTYTLSALQGTNTGVKILSPNVQMAFNQSGTIGYAVMLGAINTATGANKGYQPIIYKTSNSGVSWANITGIDFSSPSMSLVIQSLAAVNTNPTLSIPYFHQFDIAVDASNKLHLGAIIASTANDHNDSLNYVSQFGNEKYLWPHTPGLRPFIYDFIGNGAGPWEVIAVDSLWTEDPGADPSQPGFAVNPWDASGINGEKINIEPRLQLARTPDGNYITYSWSESDTNFIAGTKKWNIIPDIKARCFSVLCNKFSNNEINVSKVAAGQGTNNIQVSGKAFLQFMAPVTGSQTGFSGASSSTVDINTPFTVTNSSPLSQLTNNKNWYAKAKLSWFWYTSYYGPWCFVNLKQNEINPLNAFTLYPNPTNKNTTLAINLIDNSDVSMGVYNVVGQLLKTINANGIAGENTIELDLKNLSSGIYLVKINVGNESSIKKLIIE